FFWTAQKESVNSFVSGTRPTRGEEMFERTVRNGEPASLPKIEMSPRRPCGAEASAPAERRPGHPGGTGLGLRAAREHDAEDRFGAGRVPVLPARAGPLQPAGARPPRGTRSPPGSGKNLSQPGYGVPHDRAARPGGGASFQGAEPAQGIGRDAPRREPERSK